MPKYIPFLLIILLLFTFPTVLAAADVVPRIPLDTLLRSLAASVQHGSRDNDKSFEELTALARHETLVLDCGGVSNYAREVLTLAGYEAHVVYLYTLQPYNGDDGHVVLEVMHPIYGETVVDLDFNRMYVESVADFLKARTQPIMLANDKLLWAGQFGDMPGPDPEAADEYPRVAQRAVIY